MKKRNDTPHLSEAQIANAGPFLTRKARGCSGQDIDTAWAAEVDRRWAEIESGKHVGISLEESISKARKLLA